MAQPINETLLVDKVKTTFETDITATTVFRGDVTHVVEARALRRLLSFLKSDAELQFNYLVDVLAVDYYDREPRFEVVYHLYSIPKKHRLRVKVRVPANEPVPTISDLWQGADWPEREAFDMFGIVFEGHPNLKRIYLPQDWDGYPLRKDYPLRGYKDRYNPFGEDSPLYKGE